MGSSGSRLKSSDMFSLRILLICLASSADASSHKCMCARDCAGGWSRHVKECHRQYTFYYYSCYQGALPSQCCCEDPKKASPTHLPTPPPTAVPTRVPTPAPTTPPPTTVP